MLNDFFWGFLGWWTSFNACFDPFRELHLELSLKSFLGATTYHHSIPQSSRTPNQSSTIIRFHHLIFIP
ncbi:hypothetical protein HanPSC8_Chr09g0372151 [Helianthus annuus]|nr:hypothetical protein HanPSC8_Chr09g0372151 [Helianthus annuus]